MMKNTLFKKYSFLGTLLVSLYIVQTVVQVFFGAFILRPAEAAFNRQINYQGKLTTPTNIAVADGTYHMKFWLLTSPSAATTTALWTEDRSTAAGDRITVRSGLFSVMLGSSTSLANVDFNQTLYLGVEIGGSAGTPTWDGEMSPRKILGAVPAAFEAARLGGITATQFVRTDASSTIATSSATTLLTITQQGAGDVFNAYSASTQVFSILQNGNVGLGSSSPSSRLTIANGNMFIGGTITSTSTATSTFSGGISMSQLAITGAATSTSQNGFNIASGCYAINGFCLATGANAFGTTSIDSSLKIANIVTDETGSGNLVFSNNTTLASTTLTGSTTMTNATATTMFASIASSTNLFATNLLAGNATTSGRAYFGGNVGIGTTSPFAKLSILANSGESQNPLFLIASSSIYGDGSSLNLFSINRQGGVVIGGSDATIGGSTISPVGSSTQLSVLFGTTTATLIAAKADPYTGGRIVTQGDYAYVGGTGCTGYPTLYLYNISNPASPLQLSSLQIDTTVCTGFNGMAVQGSYLYTLDPSTNLTVVDVSNPLAPSIASKNALNAVGDGITVQGHYAYIVNKGSVNNFEIWDISNPVSPARVGQGTMGLVSGSSSQVVVQGRYAYISIGGAGNAFEIWDISNPASPTRVSSNSTGGWSGVMTVEGHYAYITNASTANFGIWDISNPTSPTRVYTGSIATNYIIVRGRTMYTGAGVYDVSNPAQPILIAPPFGNNSANSFASIQGRYAYVSYLSGVPFSVYDLGGAYIQQLEAGSLQASSLSLRNDLFASNGSFLGGLSIGQSLNVNGSGNFSLFATTSLATTPALTSTVIDNNLSSIVDAFSISHVATGTPTAGIGTGLLFKDELFCFLANCNSATSTLGATSTARIASVFQNLATTSPLSDLAFFTKKSSAGLTEGMRLTSGGNLGLGTTSPFGKFAISLNNGDTSFFNNAFLISSSTALATTTLFSISNTGSTTAANGFNITSGCYAVNGVCLTSGGSTAGAFGTTSIDTSLKIANIVTDETGSGNLVFSNNATMASTTFTASTTFANATATTLFSTISSSTNEFTTNLLASNATNTTLFAAIASSTNLFSTNALLSNGTSTSWFSSIASSTNLFTQNGNAKYATTTGSAYVGGNLSIGSSSPFAKLSVFANAGETARSLFAVGSSTANATTTLFQILNSGNIGISTSTPSSLLALDKTSGLNGTSTAGIKEYFRFVNTGLNAVNYGNEAYMINAGSATSTLVGGMIRIEDSSLLGNTIRGFEVQAHRGTTTKGENTALSGFGRTFGVRGSTEGDAGDTYLPAGVFAETRGTTQGNALRAYSGTITTEDLVNIFQDTSAFSGAGLAMDFGNAGGSFTQTAKFLDLQVAGTSRFTITSQGTTTIGDGTTSHQAGLQIGFGGLCVDNDGTCIASTTGRISSVSSFTGNSDLAEMYFSSQALEAGDIVSTQGALSIGRSNTQSRNKVLGVVSTKPGLAIGADDTSLIAGQGMFPVALSGRVPVRLSTEGGVIKAGDKIMLSTIPGVGMKATSSGEVVGVALEDFDGTRAYTDGFINQFGDDLVSAQMKPRETNVDPRQGDGCYFGAGAALGEGDCKKKDVPLISEVPAQEEAEKRAAAEKKEAVRKLAYVVASTTQTVSGESVHTGKALLFVNLGMYQLSQDTDILVQLRATTTLFDGSESTLWDSLKELAHNFAHGVLSILRLNADEVHVKDKLCVDEVCMTADDFRALLKKANTPASAGASFDPESVVVDVKVKNAPTPSAESSSVPQPTTTDTVTGSGAQLEGSGGSTSVDEPAKTGTNPPPPTEAPLAEPSPAEVPSEPVSTSEPTI